MDKEFCTYNQALRLKALGFDEPCFAFYNGKHLDFNVWDWEYPVGQKRRDIGECPLAPTFSQAFKWFREKHELSCSVELTDNSRHYYFDFTIYDSKNRDWNDEDCFDSCKRIYDDGKFDTYEEAELACLDKLLEIVESKSER